MYMYMYVCIYIYTRYMHIQTDSQLYDFVFMQEKFLNEHSTHPFEVAGASLLSLSQGLEFRDIGVQVLGCWLPGLGPLPI